MYNTVHILPEIFCYLSTLKCGIEVITVTVRVFRLFVSVRVVPIFTSTMMSKMKVLRLAATHDYDHSIIMCLVRQNQLSSFQEGG